jgi:hypothetical protein
VLPIGSDGEEKAVADKREALSVRRPGYVAFAVELPKEPATDDLHV